MARSRMSRAESPPVLAINRCTSGQGGPTGSPSCWKQARTINPGGDAGHTPSACGRMSKESTQSFGTARHRDTTPTPFSVVGQKRIHIFQGNIVERMILLAQPAQELLHMPALSADG